MILGPKDGPPGRKKGVFGVDFEDLLLDIFEKFFFPQFSITNVHLIPRFHGRRFPKNTVPKTSLLCRPWSALRIEMSRGYGDRDSARRRRVRHGDDSEDSRLLLLNRGGMVPDAHDCKDGDVIGHRGSMGATTDYNYELEICIY